MTKTIYPTNHRPVRNKVLIWTLVSIVVLVFATNNFLTTSFPTSFLKFGDYLYESFFSFPRKFYSENRLLTENENLNEEISGLRNALVDLGAIQHENDRLHKELNLKPVGNFLGGIVIARSPQIPLDTILIDRGVNDGVKVGDFILVSNRILIGKVTTVFGSRSIVSLNSFSKTVSYGYLERTNEPIEVEGSGGGSLKAKLPIDFNIENGDKVMVEGARAYAIAVVNLIENDQASGFKNIFLTLPTDVSRTKVVFIESVGK